MNVIYGNSRILKWWYVSTIFSAIFWGYIPWNLALKKQALYLVGTSNLGSWNSHWWFGDTEILTKRSNLVGGFNPSGNMSQLGWWNSQDFWEEKIFQSTNQKHVHHVPSNFHDWNPSSKSPRQSRQSRQLDSARMNPSSTRRVTFKRGLENFFRRGWHIHRKQMICDSYNYL